MNKKFMGLLLLTILVGSIFLVNYIVLKQTESEEDKVITTQLNEQEINSERNNSSEVITEDSGSVSYDTLFDNTVLHHFKIVISQEEWDGLSEDMLDMQDVDDRMRTGNYRKADLYYKDMNGDVILGEVGVRTKGNTSRVLPETSEGLHRFNFKLKFDEVFDLVEGSDEYETRMNRMLGEVTELNFKANDGADSTNIREIYSYELINKYEIYAPKASLATLTIVIEGVEHNFGIVKFIESVDKNFLTKRFGKENNDGNLYKCLWQNYGPASLMPVTREISIGLKEWSENYRPTYDLKTNKTENNYKDLLEFINNINTLENGEFKNYIKEHFAVDRFIKSQALDVLLGNIDGYRSMGNNYYLYFNEDGIIEWIPFDYDNILGAGWDGEPYWSYEGIATADIYKWNNLNASMYDPNTTHPLIDKILAIDEYRKEYEDCLNFLIDQENGYFSYESFLELYHQLYDLYGSSVDNEMQEGNRWELSNEEWYFKTKIDSVSKQLN